MPSTNTNEVPAGVPMRSDNPYLFLVDGRGAEAAGHVAAAGQQLAVRLQGEAAMAANALTSGIRIRGSVVLIRGDRDLRMIAGWGHLYGPLAPVPSQQGERDGLLIEVECTGSTPSSPESWTTTGRSWWLGTASADITAAVSDPA